AEMGACVRRAFRLLGLASLVAICASYSNAWGSVADVLREPKFNHLELAPIAPALAATVASTYPVASASSSVVYVYNPALDTFERQTGVTYGISRDLDLNATLPLLRTSLDLAAHTRVPDPRFPRFGLPPGDPHAQIKSLSASGDDVGVGDLLLRAKYVLLRSDRVDVA